MNAASPDITSAGPGRESWFSRKRLFQIHGWLGMSLGSLLFVICFSGAAAVLSHELDWLANPVIRVQPAGEVASWGRWLRSAQDAHPDWRPRWITAPQNRYFAAEIVMEAPSGLWRRVYVNPYTAQVQGGTSYFNIQRFLRDFHRLLNIFAGGLFLVASFGFVLLFSVVSGLLFYKNFWRNLFQLRFHKGPRALWSDVHRLLGTWAFLFAAIIAVTGIWYFIEYASFYANGAAPASPLRIARDRLIAHGPSPSLADVDTLLRNAQKAYPDLTISSLHFPITSADPALVYGQSAALLVRDRANTVALDPFDASVLHVQRADRMSLGERWQDSADPLHFGDFAGLPGKLLWSLFGLTLPAMILSGGYLSVRKSRPLVRDFTWRRVRRWTIWTWASLAIMGASVYYSIPAATRYKTPAIPRYASHGTHSIGPWRVSVEAGGHSLRLRFHCGSPDCQVNMQSPTLALQGGHSLKPKAWAAYWSAAAIEIPAAYNGVVKIVAEDWAGGKHAAAVTVPRQSLEDDVKAVPGEGPFTGFGVWVFLIPFLLILSAIFVAWIGYFGGPDRALP
ncbi:MAG TPA: PepSY-associated TM helix domain-containing protein [Bryobacteraceae bacterium]|nr:PepSY-associated TM helix domain-containing protein [Bryobacteraceae bacterium]